MSGDVFLDITLLVLLGVNVYLVGVGVAEDVMPTAILAALSAAWCAAMLVLL